MSFERLEIRRQVGIGTKLVLIGGILFVIAFAAHGSQPSLGFEEQSLLSLVIMVSVPVWVIGGVCLGVAADNWLVSKGQGKMHQIQNLDAPRVDIKAGYVQADKVDNISVLNMLKPQKQAIRTDYLCPTILKGEECVMYVHALKSKNW